MLVGNCPRGWGRGVVHTQAGSNILRLQADIQNRVVAHVIIRCACHYIDWQLTHGDYAGDDLVMVACELWVGFLYYHMCSLPQGA